MNEGKIEKNSLNESKISIKTIYKGKHDSDGKIFDYEKINSDPDMKGKNIGSVLLFHADWIINGNWNNITHLVNLLNEYSNFKFTDEEFNLIIGKKKKSLTLSSKNLDAIIVFEK